MAGIPYHWGKDVHDYWANTRPVPQRIFSDKDREAYDFLKELRRQPPGTCYGTINVDYFGANW